MNYSSENEKEDAFVMDRVVRHLIRRGITISVMESCTGGLFSSRLTDTEGASSIFSGSFVTYSNEAKGKNGVPCGIIEDYGVYSTQTAEAMASACRSFYHTDLGVGITGSTGNPDPNNADSIPGEVCYAILSGQGAFVDRMKIETENRTRHEIKEGIADHVACALAEFLEI